MVGDVLPRRIRDAVDDVSHDVLQALTKRVGNLGKNHKAIALGQQRHRLTDDGEHAGLGDDLDHSGPLALNGNRWIVQCLAQAFVLGEEAGQFSELRLDGREICLFLQRDVEQRSGITGGGSSVCHWFSRGAL